MPIKMVMSLKQNILDKLRFVCSFIHYLYVAYMLQKNTDPQLMICKTKELAMHNLPFIIQTNHNYKQHEIIATVHLGN